MRIRSIFTFSLCLLTLLVAGGCQTGSAPTANDSATPSEAVLRVGITPNAPPLIFKAGGTYRGLDAELAPELAEFLGRELQFIELPWERLIPSLRAGKVDIIMSAMSVTRARARSVAFTEPYASVGQIPLVRSSDQHLYGSYGAIILTKGQVGVEKGTTADQLVQDQFHYAKRVTFTSPEEGSQALIRGDIDMFVQDSPVIHWYASVHEADGLVAVPRLLTREFLGWAVRRDDSDLLARVNQFLAAKSEDGTLQNAVNRWIQPE